MSRTTLLRIAIGVAVVAAAVGIGMWLHDFPAHHFGTVEAGVLYRTGQPSRAGWDAIRSLYGIRTVINLRRYRPQDDWWKTEMAFCKEHGIENVHLQVATRGLTDEQLARFLEIVRDPACHPVLVHCEAGSSRTGVTVGAYRILEQGWDLDKTLDDIARYRFRPHVETGHAAWLRELVDQRAPRLEAPDGPHASADADATGRPDDRSRID